jgi:biotin-(acetyl-CoA carboxylase) ligase
MNLKRGLRRRLRVRIAAAAAQDQGRGQAGRQWREMEKGGKRWKVEAVVPAWETLEGRLNSIVEPCPWKRVNLTPGAI